MDKDIRVSVFGNIRAKKPQEFSLYEMLSHILKGTFKEQILYLREIYESDPEKYKAGKDSLPAFTPSGTFNGKTAKDLLSHNGIACIDIDGKDNPHITDFEKLRDEVAKIENVFFSALSVSGKGIFCLIKITDNPDQHKAHMNALMKCFDGLGIKIDSKCDNTNRLRFVSDDANAILKEIDPIPFTRALDKKPLKRNKITHSSTNNFKYTKTKSDDTFSKVEAIVDKIESKGIDITGDHGQWLRLGFALAREFGEEGRDLFDRISRQSPLYNKTIDTDEQYTRCLNSESSGSEVTIGTFFHIAKEEGV